jgi:hypothetical protein
MVINLKEMFYVLKFPSRQGEEIAVEIIEVGTFVESKIWSLKTYIHLL